MCGIAGAVDANAARAADRVGSLNDGQSHRGPDHRVVAQIGRFTLGNTRLAIQHPGPEANQPFISTAGRYHCVFNGEIYNHRRLVDRYGLQVRTACDGEIIPELWSKLGPESLAELQGMFAIALVDSLEERLYLARDPFGIKPLYWRSLPEGLLFASEVRPLIRVGGAAQIDADAIGRYLHLGALAADQAPYRGMTALPPNSLATFDRDGRPRVTPILAGGPLAARGQSTGLQAALTDSVKLHLGADVPTVLLLSAGVDSATIAATSRRLGRDLECMTVATEGAADESPAAAQTARHYGHRFRRISAALDSADIGAFFTAMQRPSIDGLNTYVVCKAVRAAGFKVALSGLGGDEAVGGYSHFRLLRHIPALRVLDAMPRSVAATATTVLARAGLRSQGKLARLLAADGPREGRGFSLLQREVLPMPLVNELTGVESRRAADVTGSVTTGSSAGFGAMVAAELAIYLQATLLPDADCFSMTSSVEMRVPFVDTQVFAAILELAAGARTAPGKTLFGRALQDPYLSALAAQPKRGFSLPMARWLTGPLAPVLRAAEAPGAPVWSVVDRQRAKRAGLLPLRTGERWSEAWVVAALNAWLDPAEL